MIATGAFTVIVTLIVNQFTDLCPWLAPRIARWSASRRYRGNAQRASTRADELAALIKARPGSLLKLLTALGFAAAAIPAGSRTPSPRFVNLFAAIGFRHVVSEIAVATGDSVTVPDMALGDHMDQCAACRHAVWRSAPVAMLAHGARHRRSLVSSDLGWRWTSVVPAAPGSSSPRPCRVPVDLPALRRAIESWQAGLEEE
jgi:hypothetical protein